MNARIVTFSSHGDTTLLEYDPASADMDEVNKVIAEYEAKTGAQPFDMATGERIKKVTRKQDQVLMVHPDLGRLIVRWLLPALTWPAEYDVASLGLKAGMAIGRC